MNLVIIITRLCCNAVNFPLLLVTFFVTYIFNVLCSISGSELGSKLYSPSTLTLTLYSNTYFSTEICLPLCYLLFIIIHPLSKLDGRYNACSQEVDYDRKKS